MQEPPDRSRSFLREAHSFKIYATRWFRREGYEAYSVKAGIAETREICSRGCFMRTTAVCGRLYDYATHVTGLVKSRERR